MEPYMHGGVEGYSYAQAQQVIGVKHQNYVRQLVSQGKIGVVGRMPTAEGSEVTRTLLSITDVAEVARKYQNRANDDAHVYSVRLTAEAMAWLTANWPTELVGKLELGDLTEQRRKHAKASSTKKKAAKAKSAKAEKVSKGKAAPAA